MKDSASPPPGSWLALAVFSVLAVSLLAATASPVAAQGGAAQGAPDGARAEEPVLVSVSAGYFDIGNQVFDTLEWGLEVRLAPQSLGFLPEPFHLRPIVGGTVNQDRGFWLYGGLRLDYEVGHWVLTPSFGVSYYDAGDGEDLGGPLEFRSAAEIAYRLDDGPRLGISFYHLSHADIYDENPGANSLVLTWTVPVGR